MCLCDSRKSNRRRRRRWCCFGRLIFLFYVFSSFHLPVSVWFSSLSGCCVCCWFVSRSVIVDDDGDGCCRNLSFFLLNVCWFFGYHYSWSKTMMMMIMVMVVVVMVMAIDSTLTHKLWLDCFFRFWWLFWNDGKYDDDQKFVFIFFCVNTHKSGVWNSNVLINIDSIDFHQNHHWTWTGFDFESIDLDRLIKENAIIKMILICWSEIRSVIWLCSNVCVCVKSTQKNNF